MAEFNIDEVCNLNNYEPSSDNPTMGFRGTREEWRECRDIADAEGVPASTIIRDGWEIRRAYGKNSLKLIAHQEKVIEFLNNLPMPLIMRR